MDVEPDSRGTFDLSQAVHSQSLLVARTGIEAGLSEPISFDSLKDKALPLERPDLETHPNLEVIRTSLTDAVHFILDLEEREFAAHPWTVHQRGSDKRLNPCSPVWAGKSKDASTSPDTWADALVETGDMYGYDEDHWTWISIRRVMAALAGETFFELTPTPFQTRWKE